jgi:hypothetical protein
MGGFGNNASSNALQGMALSHRTQSPGHAVNMESVALKVTGDSYTMIDESSTSYARHS